MGKATVDKVIAVTWDRQFNSISIFKRKKKSFEVKSEHKGNGRRKKANRNEMGIEDYKGQRTS